MFFAEDGTARSSPLFNLIKQRLNSPLPLVRCTKTTLVHLSHSLENMILNHRIPAVIFAGFQESRHWQQETARYRALAQVARQVCIFSTPPLPPESEAGSIYIPLQPADPLGREWFLAVLSDPLSVILCGQDSRLAVAKESARQFETLWSFDPPLINAALDVLEEVVANYRPEKLSQVQEARRSYSPAQTDLALLTEFTLHLVRLEERLHHRYREIEAHLKQHQSYLEAQVARRTNELATMQQRYRDHLEDLVIERTAELRAANQNLRREIAERKRAEAEQERLLAAEQEQRLLAETMREVTLTLTSQIDHTAVLDEILRQAQRIVPCSAAHIVLLQDNILRMARWQGYDAFGCEEFMASLTQRVDDFLMSKAVIQARTGLVIPDTAQEPTWKVIAPTAWIRGHLIMPICLQERVLGLLRLDSDVPGQFSAQDAQRLQALSGAAAIALENARLYMETQQRLKEQTALREAIALISSPLDLTTVLNQITEHMGRAIDVTSAYLNSYEVETGASMVLAEYYSPQAKAEERESDLGVSYDLRRDFPSTLAFLQSGQPSQVMHADDGGVLEADMEHIRRFGGQSVLFIRLQAGAELLGYATLWESRRRREFTAEEVSLGQALGQQAAGAIQHAQLHEQTRRQARQMQQILDSVETGLLLLDADYHIKLANPAGRVYLSMLTDAQLGQTLTHLGNHLLEDLLILPHNSYYHEVMPREATHPIFEVTARPVQGKPKTEGWVLVVRDVTAERDTQKRMQQQEKLAAVGQLAAGIAHDFNNILTSVIGFAELAQTTPATPDSVRRDLAQIVKQGQRGAHLVRQILDFARQNISTKRALGFSQFLEDMVQLLERTISETIRLELEIEPHHENYTIQADPTQLQQVLTNLAVNAADAMPLGGVLRFHLARFMLAPGQRPPYPGMPPGQWLVLTISDTGVGIPPEIRAHIFEPFFTTKEVGQGTGLGLAQVDGIIKQHGGYINMESEVGQGTTFTIFLPELLLSKTDSPGLGQAQKTQAGGETILLVEDNLSVLIVVSAMLERLGYHVLTATNGREALEVCYQHQANIALVITDLAMPEMDGLTLARILQTNQLHPKILAITGYPLKLAQSDLSALGIVDWLQKPINMELLAYKLEQVLPKKP